MRGNNLVKVAYSASYNIYIIPIRTYGIAMAYYHPIL